MRVYPPIKAVALRPATPVDVPLIVGLARLETAVAPPLTVMVGAGEVVSTGATVEADTRSEPVAVVATVAAEAGAATATSAPSATTAGTSTPTTRRLTVNRPRSVAVLVEVAYSPCVACV